VHSSEWNGLSKLVGMMADGTIHNEVKKIKERVAELERLAETYVRGGNIIQAKLTGTAEND